VAIRVPARKSPQGGVRKETLQRDFADQEFPRRAVNTAQYALEQQTMDHQTSVKIQFFIRLRVTIGLQKD
jgi:hypothetical protein